MDRLRELEGQAREAKRTARRARSKEKVAKSQHFRLFKQVPAFPYHSEEDEAASAKWEEAKGYEDIKDDALEKLARTQAGIKRLKVARAQADRQRKQAEREEEIRRRYERRRQ